GGLRAQAHLSRVRGLAAGLDLTDEDLARPTPIHLVAHYLSELHRLFVDSDYLTALGSELAVEVTAAAEFRYFYPGLKKYGDFSERDLAFFELHMEIEDCHSAWLVEAVRKTAQDRRDLEQVAAGARTTADAWQCFWDGMYQEVF